MYPAVLSSSKKGSKFTSGCFTKSRCILFFHQWLSKVSGCSIKSPAAFYSSINSSQALASCSIKHMLHSTHLKITRFRLWLIHQSIFCIQIFHQRLSKVSVSSIKDYLKSVFSISLPKVSSCPITCCILLFHQWFSTSSAYSIIHQHHTLSSGILLLSLCSDNHLTANWWLRASQSMFRSILSRVCETARRPEPESCWAKNSFTCGT